MWEMILAGRYMMIPITLASLVGLAVLIERVVVLRQGRIVVPEIAEAVGWRWAFPWLAIGPFAGIVAMISILVVIGAQAVQTMDLGFISELTENIVPGYFNILVAVIIFAGAFFIANFLSNLVPSPFWAKVVKVGVIVFLGAVALQKANISSLTNDTFQTLITAAIVASAFAVGVGGAIALGLGGRERAKSFLDKLN